MTEINSPLGRKVISSGNQNRQVLTVDDETEIVEQPVKLSSEQFNNIQAKRQEVKQLSKKPTSEAKLRVELLTGIGRLQTEVVVEDHKFSLQSLKAGEMKEVMRSLSDTSVGTDAMYEMRTHILSRSLYAINNQSIDLVIGATALEEVISFIDNLQEELVNKLYAGYTSMVSKNEDKLTITSAEQAKEVAEEIKKV